MGTVKVKIGRRRFIGGLVIAGTGGVLLGSGALIWKGLDARGPATLSWGDVANSHMAELEASLRQQDRDQLPSRESALALLSRSFAGTEHVPGAAGVRTAASEDFHRVLAERIAREYAAFEFRSVGSWVLSPTELAIVAMAA